MNKHTKVIGGITYTTTTLPATKGLVIMPRVLKLFGATILKILFEAESDEDRQALLSDPQVIAALLTEIAGNAAEDNGLLVVVDILQTTTADKVKIGDTTVSDVRVTDHFDEHFSGRYAHLAEVTMWVASCNFGEP